MAKKRKLRTRNDGTYSYIHDALKGYINEIDALGVAVYWFISTYTSVDKEYCWPGRKTIAKGLNKDVRVIDKYLKKLESTNPPLIERVERPGKTDKIYFLPVKIRVSTKNVVSTKIVEGVSTKNEDTTLCKKCSTNKNHKNKNHKNKKHSPKKRGSESVDNSLFDDSLDKLNKSKLKNSFEYKCSIQLYNGLKSKGKIIQTKIKLKEWMRHFRELMQSRTKRRITVVLNWYLKRFRERWCPKCYCARTFKENFARIEDAMRRYGDGALLEDDEEEDEYDYEQEQFDNRIEPIYFTNKSGQKVKRSFDREEHGFILVDETWKDNKGQRKLESYEIEEDELENYLEG